MRYFVTGIGGFAGTHLAALPLAGGTGDRARARAASLPGSARARGRVIPRSIRDGIVCADVADADAIRRAIATARPDGVFHSAGIAFVPRAESIPRARSS